MTRNHRAGITLMEVLVTIFIMGIGLLAILTLFPLAAINMARAVKDDRSYQCARSMDGLFRTYWKTEIVEKAGAGDPLLFNTLDNPGGGLPPAGAFEASYPVVVDPWLYTVRPGWVGDGTATRVPRRTMAMFFPPPVGPTPPVGQTPLSQTNQAILSTLSLKDTVGYDEDLRLTADREYRYNAMAIVQRPLNGNRFAAHMTVVVFDERAFLYDPPGTEAVFGLLPAPAAPTSTVTFTPGTTTIVVNHAPGAGPEVRKGNWVMDASVAPTGNNPVRPLIRHANMYQIVSVTPDAVNPNTITYLEVQTPIQTTDRLPDAYFGTLVVMRGVSGVYPRSPLAAGE